MPTIQARLPSSSELKMPKLDSFDTKNNQTPYGTFDSNEPIEDPLETKSIPSKKNSTPNVPTKKINGEMNEAEFRRATTSDKERI